MKDKKISYRKSNRSVYKYSTKAPKKETHFKIFFFKSNDSSESFNKYTYYHRLGHSKQYCPFKIVTHRGKLTKSVWIANGVSTSQNEIIKMEWIPKDTRFVSTNFQESKKVWIHKVKVWLCSCKWLCKFNKKGLWYFDSGYLRHDRW